MWSCGAVAVELHRSQLESWLRHLLFDAPPPQVVTIKKAIRHH